MHPIHVLFVCMGNICRSPAGEGVFKHYVNERGLNGIINVDSAGTIGYHAGASADERMRQAAVRRGYRLDSIARKVSSRDLSEFDLLIAMDPDNLEHLERLAHGPQPHVRLLGSFLPETLDNFETLAVPDPYYGGADGFEQVLDMIEQACPAILEHCLKLPEQS